MSDASPSPSASSVPAEMGMLRCLQFVESVYRLNFVPEGESSSTLKYMQDVIAANTSASSVPCQYAKDIGMWPEHRCKAGHCEYAANPAPSPSASSVPVASEHTQLMSFYAVETTGALISAMAHHIEKLQSKLPQYRDPVNQRVREG